MAQPPKPIQFQQVIDALLNMDQPFPARFLHRFSDIPPEDLQALQVVWSQVKPARRVALLEDLESARESDLLMSYDVVAEFALSDQEPGVRAAAVRLLNEDQPARLVPVLVQLLQEDPDPVVRSSAASSLGQFVFYGELEEIPADRLKQVEESLLAAASVQEEEIVRKRALESLGFSSRSEAVTLIQEAINQDDPDWLTTALYAIGRSADTRWQESVLALMDHPDEDVQIEAVRAAGHLELASARPILIDWLTEGIEEEDLRSAAIWSVSQIGGQGVSQLLQALAEETEDDEEVEFIEEALENLMLTDGLNPLGMFDFAEQGREEDFDYLADLDLDEDNDPSDPARPRQK
jgi:hypothetical protein